jgi:hypothetical protein
MATTSWAGLAAAGVIGAAMPMRRGASAGMSALEVPAAARREAVETRIAWRLVLGACATVAPREGTGGKECET